jgi:cytochrome c556
MRFGVAFALAGIATSLAGSAHGADDPIKARQQIMKKNGAAAKVGVDFLRGTAIYDPVAAAGALKTIEDDLTAFPALFPAGSETGDTAAGPAIWTDMDGFKAFAAKTAADAKAASASAPGGVNAFKTAFMAVASDCQACHEKYRKSR